MNKSGQFFLVAALIVVVIIIGLATVYTSVRTGQEDPSIESLSKEISFEGAQVIDYGVFQGNNSAEIENFLNELGETYSNINPDSQITIIYFVNNTAQGTSYDIQNTYSIDLLGTGVSGQGPVQVNVPITIVGDKAIVHLNNQTFEFEVREGQTPFVIISKEGVGETHTFQSP